MAWSKGSGKYHRLADYLAAQPAGAVTRSFPQIEALMRWPLPSSALLPAWWRATATRHLTAVGWAVAALDRRGALVTFVRVAAETNCTDATAAPAGPS